MEDINLNAVFASGLINESLETNYFTHFSEAGKVSTTADAAEWLITSVGTDTDPLVQDEAGGVMKWTTGTTAGNHICLARNAEVFKINANKPFLFATRVKFHSVTTADAFIGMCVNATAPYSSEPADGVFFRLDGDGNLDYKTISSGGSANTTGDTGFDIVADTWYVLSFLYKPTAKRLEFYVDYDLKIAKSQIATSIPTGVDLTIAYDIQSNGAGEVFSTDWCMVKSRF